MVYLNIYFLGKTVLCFTELKIKKNCTAPPSKAQRAQQKRKRREFKSQRHWRTTRKECLPETEGLLHTGPQDKTDAIPNLVKKGRWAQCSSLDMELLATVSCWEKERQFSLRV